MFALVIALFYLRPLSAEPTPAALSAFHSYGRTVESTLNEQHRSSATFLPQVSPSVRQRLLRGELLIEQIKPPDDPALAGALLHHWRGTAFVPEADAQSFERLLKNLNAFPQVFAPEVLRARVFTRQEDYVQASLRVRQKHVIAVVMDMTYDITFGRLDPRHGYSASRSTSISEVEAAGTADERALTSSQEHGFLWRLNTYWTYEEREGGLYLQVESISLTRAIPLGLGWALRPYVESVPRAAIEFTLRSARTALEKGTQ